MEIVNSHEHSARSAEVDDKGSKRKGSKRAIASDDDDNYVRVKSKSDEEEVDERMVEESLSDMCYSQRPSPPQEPTCNQEKEGTPTSSVRAQSPAYIRQDTAEESTLTVLASTSSKPDPPSKKRAHSSSPSSSFAATESRATTKSRILSKVTSRSTPRPRKRMKTTTISEQEWEEINDFQSQQVMDSGMVPGHDKNEKGISEKLPELDSAGTNLNYPVVEELHPSSPAERSMLGQASRSRAESAAGSGSHSLSGRGTKSIPTPISRSMKVGSPGTSATSSSSIIIPTTPLRKGSGANDEEHGHRSPILSPRAKKRLEIFDRAVMETEFRKEKEQRLDDGIIFDKAKKSSEMEGEEGKDGEMIVAGGGRQEHGFVRTSNEEKSWKGKEMKEDKARASTTKPPEIKKRKTAEPSDEPDSQDQPALRPKNSVGSEGSQDVEADLAVESNDIDMDTQTSTGIVEQQLDPIHLRQEEEESTQDLVAELPYQRQQGVGVGRSTALVPEIINDTGDLLPAIDIDSQPISEAILDTGVQNRDAGNNEESDCFLGEIPSVFIIFVSYQTQFC